MPKRLLPVVSLFFVLCFQEVYGFDFSCPATVVTKQELQKPVTGWTAWVSPTPVERSLLLRIDFYDGHPSQRALLKPDNGDTSEDPLWTFVPREGQKKTEIWQACVYAQTRVTLIRELPCGLKECKVAYNRTIRPQIDAVACK